MPHTRYSFLISPLVILTELIILFFTLFYFIHLQYIERDSVDHSLKFLVRGHYKAYLILSISWILIGINLGIYKFSRGVGLAFLLQKTFVQFIIFSIILFAVSGLKTADLLNINNSIYLIFTFSFLVYFFRVVVFLGLKSYRNSGYNNRRVLFIDYNSNTENIINLFKERKDFGYNVFGIINGNNIDGLAISNFNIEDFKKIIDKYSIQIIFISLGGALPQETINDIKIIASKKKVKVQFIPSAKILGLNDLRLNYIETYPILVEKQFPLENALNWIFKRGFDIIFSIIVLIILSFVFPFIAFFIFIESGFPIFFIQKRKGLDGKVFNCYKFRSMKLNNESNRKITTKGDSRITKIGGLMRSTSIDELPQFLNVLLGDMSVVGPRPHMVLQDDEYAQLIQNYTLRQHVKPGITGLSQISGFRGEINSNEDMELRVRTDLYYIRNWSFFLDIIIIFKTGLKMITGDKNAI